MRLSSVNEVVGIEEKKKKKKKKKKKTPPANENRGTSLIGAVSIVPITESGPANRIKSKSPPTQPVSRLDSISDARNERRECDAV